MTRLKYFILRSITCYRHLCHNELGDFHRKLAFHAHFTAFLNRFAQLGCAKRNVAGNLLGKAFLPSTVVVFLMVKNAYLFVVGAQFATTISHFLMASAFLRFL